MNPTALKTAVTTPIQIIGELVQIIRTHTIDYYKTTSLSESVKLSRVEPITVVSRDVMNLDYMPDVMQSVLSIFAGYYLQAVALSAKIGGVRVTKILDRLNPDRDSSGFFMGLESHSSPDVLVAESYQFKLPKIAMEGAFKRLMAGEELVQEEGEDPVMSSEVDRQIGGRNALVEASNLAVGKMLMVDIVVDDVTTQVPVNVRLAPAILPDSTVSHILALHKDDTTFVERYHKWRAGRITFIRDLMLCRDLIDQHRKALMNDEQGVYSEIIRRVNNAKKYGLLTQNPSLASASSIFVFSEEIAKRMEADLGGKLSNPRVREKAFNNTYAMILVVVDREWERVTMYFRGVAAATEVSIKDIKSANKSKGPDIGDIMKTFMQGQGAPSF